MGSHIYLSVRMFHLHKYPMDINEVWCTGVYSKKLNSIANLTSVGIHQLYHVEFLH